MDSNGKYIKPDKFWRGRGKAKFITTYTTEDLISHAQSIDFSNTKHIVVSTGTNNLDRQDPEVVVTGIINGATILKEKYPDTNIFVNQLPPRKFTHKQETSDTNKFLSNRIPESFHLVIQDNIQEQHLCDDKHIDRGSIKFFVANIKSKIRDVTTKTQERLGTQQQGGRNTHCDRTHNNQHSHSHHNNRNNRTVRGNPAFNNNFHNDNNNRWSRQENGTKPPPASYPV